MKASPKMTKPGFTLEAVLKLIGFEEFKANLLGKASDFVDLFCWGRKKLRSSASRGACGCRREFGFKCPDNT